MGSPAAALTLSGPSETPLGYCTEILASGCSGTLSVDFDDDGGASGTCGGDDRHVRLIWFVPGSKSVRAECSVCSTDEDGNTACHVSGADSLSVRVQTPVVTVDGPSTGAAGQPLRFAATVTGCDRSNYGPNVWDPAEFHWQADSQDPRTASGPVTMTWQTPGVQRVTAEKFDCIGTSASHTVTITGSAATGPEIRRVERRTEGYFLAGSGFDNRFDVTVDWDGAPGTVEYDVNGEPAGAVAATSSGAGFSLDVDATFPARLEASRLRLVAVGDDGSRSEPAVEEVYRFPLPRWLESARGDGELSFRRVDRHLHVDLASDLPELHFGAGGSAAWEFPAWVPLVGGDSIGFAETVFDLDGEVSGRGPGEIRISGQTGFTLLSRSVGSDVEGRGDLRLRPGEGLTLTSGYYGVTVDGTAPLKLKLDPDRGLGRLLRRLAKPVERFVPVDRILRFLQLDVSAHALGRLRGGLLQTPDGELVPLPATTDVGLGGLASLTVQPERFSKVSMWVLLDGTVYGALPPPFLQGADLEVELGAKLWAAYLFSTVQGQVGVRYVCRLRRPATAECAELEATGGFAATPRDGRVAAVHWDVATLDDGARSAGVAVAGGRSVRAAAGADQRHLVDDVFPGAAPHLVATPQGLLALWLHQDGGKPAARSLDVAWSLRTADGWSPPARVADDQRLELAPAAAVDGRGRVVAAWLRSADAAWTRPVEDGDDLAAFFGQLEVVTATFDATARTWSEVRPLTADVTADSDPRLHALAGGRVLLTWLSGPRAPVAGGEDTNRLRAAVWDPAAAAWSAPVDVATHLPATARYAAAAHRDGAFALVEGRAADGRATLDLRRWDGERWSAAGPWDGTGESSAPLAVTDSAGVGHAVWIHDGALLHATVEAGAAEAARVGAATPGALDAVLLAAAGGHLALVWPETAGATAADPALRVYDAARGVWGEARPLVETDGEAGDPSGVVTGDRLRLAFVDTALRTAAPAAGEDPSVARLQRGASDLRTAELTLGRNLAVEADGLAVSPRRHRPGAAGVARLEVHNSGDFTVDPFTVALSAGAPEDGGALLAEARVAAPLPSGGAVTVRFDFTLPEEPRELVALVDPVAALDETSRADNRAVAPGPGAPLSVVAAASVTSGPPPLTVRFEAVGGDAGEGLGYAWLFADGSAAAGGRTVEHTFVRPGTYPVTLIADDGRGATATDRVVVRVGGGGSGDCGDDPGALCLGDGRFEVRMTWERPDGGAGGATAVRLTQETGYFWFFRQANVEAVVKVLDGCGVNGRYWVFAGGLTNLRATLRVRDTWTGDVATYVNAQGRPFRAIQDTGALATCGATGP